MSFKYEFEGSYDSKVYPPKRFTVYKFDDGKYLKKGMQWENEDPSISANGLSATFRYIAKQSPAIITIVKLADAPLDNLIKAEVSKPAAQDAAYGSLELIFTALHDGSFLAKEKLDFLNVVILSKGILSTKIGKNKKNLSVFTFQAETVFHEVISEKVYYDSLNAMGD